VAQPAGLKAQLRPYQIEGFSWLLFLHQFKLGGILADDMGLGKTVQVISLALASRKNKLTDKPFLVIAPTSVVENWELEVKQFAPNLRCLVMRSGDRTSLLNKIIKSDLVITSYALFQRDYEKLSACQFDTLVLDEAQFVKNYHTKAYGLIKKLEIERKIAMTGTPIENNLMELWALFSLVAPGLFPEPKKFTEIYRTPIERNGDKIMLAKLRSRIKPFILRRKKEIVAKELPPKIEQISYLDLNAAHRLIYDRHLQKERQKVLGLIKDSGFKDNRFEILSSLTRMRQLCLHPELIDKKYSHIPATKVVALIEQVKDIVAEGHHILIFSQFTSLLGKVAEEVKKNNLSYLYLDGSTKNRQELIGRFKTGKTPIFLISLRAGGFGLNLTQADYVLLLDPWWNPAVENQAIDRTHRIGQKNSVFVYRLIAKNTIEEKVLALQEKKKKLFNNVLEDGEVFASLVSEEDIVNIFK
jgi:SNF2 family DNA or RNA helicase